MAVNRRDFLKLSATVAGGSMLAGGGIAGMLMAGAFLGLTLWLGRPLRRRWLREYRSVRRLIEE